MEKNVSGATNPLIWADIPDPSVICVGETYYMTSTTMYFCPGIPVMKSHDLINWEIANYVYDTLDDSDASALRNGAFAYGKGSWASSLRCHDGAYYVAVASLNTQKTYIFQTKDIENGPWRRCEIDGYYHDSSLLFDDDGRAYLVYGGGTIRVIELTPDATAIKENGMSRAIIENANEIFGAGAENGLPAEGAHIHKIDGKYYIFLIAWPKTGTNRRTQLCFRASSIEGPYEGRVALDDDLGDKNRGVAQGGVFKTPQGQWYSMLFQDHGAVGRIPVLVPVSWADGWPIFGENGKAPKALSALRASDSNSANTARDAKTAGAAYSSPIVCSDEFDKQALALCWQFNHNPVGNCWTLTERPGYFRLKTAELSRGLMDARNTLTQRAYGPKCSGTAAVEAGAMKDGDTAGLAALQEKYGYVGVKKTNGELYIVAKNAEDDAVTSIPISQERVYLRIDFDFENTPAPTDTPAPTATPTDTPTNKTNNADNADNADNVGDADTARFYYSLDETNWRSIGEPLKMEYRLSHFTGYRFALFCYATQTPGGHADFDYFRIFGGTL